MAVELGCPNKMLAGLMLMQSRILSLLLCIDSMWILSPLGMLWGLLHLSVTPKFLAQNARPKFSRLKSLCVLWKPQHMVLITVMRNSGTTWEPRTLQFLLYLSPGCSSSQTKPYFITQIYTCIYEYIYLLSQCWSSQPSPFLSNPNLFIWGKCSQHSWLRAQPICPSLLCVCLALQWWVFWEFFSVLMFHRRAEWSVLWAHSASPLHPAPWGPLPDYLRHHPGRFQCPWPWPPTPIASGCLAGCHTGHSARCLPWHAAALRTHCLWDPG